MPLILESEMFYFFFLLLSLDYLVFPSSFAAFTFPQTVLSVRPSFLTHETIREWSKVFSHLLHGSTFSGSRRSILDVFALLGCYAA